MNFLMRSTTHVDRDNNKPSSVSESRVDALPPPSQPLTGSHSLESFLSDDPYAQFGTRVEQFEGEIDGENDLKNDLTVLAKHLDVSQEEGWIAIPFRLILKCGEKICSF
ncbi:plant/MEB5-like protein [Trifolium medium]|uniref:Plant/MEB5-like protein n=1 Tax=Trifolium medium TaxID=97028 RepID=A0A392N8A0_9FABA|nr:plant/MEB5-like protein [Trifolium medium]